MMKRILLLGSNGKTVMELLVVILPDDTGWRIFTINIKTGLMERDCGNCRMKAFIYEDAEKIARKQQVYLRRLHKQRTASKLAKKK